MYNLLNAKVYLENILKYSKMRYNKLLVIAH